MRTPGCNESESDARQQEDGGQKMSDSTVQAVNTNPTNGAEQDNRSPPNILYRYPMAWFGAVWAAGTLVASSPGIQSPTWMPAMAVGIGLLLLAGLISHKISWLATTCVAFSTLMAACAFGLMRAPVGGDSLSSIAKRQSQSVALRGVISAVATWSPSQFEVEVAAGEKDAWLTQWTVDWYEIRNGTRWDGIRCRSKLMAPGRIYGLLPGDIVEVFGSLRSIPAATNPGAVDYAELAGRQDRYVSVKTESVNQIHKISSSSWFWYSRLRGWAVQKADKILHENIVCGQAPLAAALVFGQREQVDWELQQQLMTTGTIHMLAISGLHVEMIAGTLLIVCVVLSVRPQWMLRIIVGVSLLYAGLAGGNPPVLRAVVLVAGTSFARYWGLRSSLFNLLGLAAFLLLLLDPDNLHKPGVHLSFVAVATIGVFHQGAAGRLTRRSALQSLLEESLSRPRRWLLSLWRSLKDAMRISFWVWLMTCPLIWLNFNLVSLIAIPLNALLGLPLMVGLVAGLLTVVVGWFPPLGWIPGIVAGLSLELICRQVELADGIPWGHFWLPSPPTWWTVVFYLTTVVWLVICQQRFRGLLAGMLVAWIAIGVSIYLPGPRGLVGGSLDLQSSKSSALDCTFLDVGHGTCVLIELPDGRLWVYDAGRIGAENRSFRYIAPSLWAVPSARIDTMFVSHADSDHYNAIPQLLERFRFGRVVSTRSFWSSQAEGAIAVRKALDQKAIPMQTLDSLVSYDAACDVGVVVVHPPPDFRGETDNASSLCLQLEYAGTRILLCGDIEGSGLIALCEQPNRRCNILMAPHHGSLTVDVTGLLDWCQPEVTVISGGERSIRDAVLENYKNSPMLGVTFRDGAIRVSIKADGSFETLRWSGQGWSRLE